MTSRNARLIHRRHLPHWRSENAVYFVTWRLHRDQAPLSAVERSSVVSAIRHFDGDRYRLFAFVAMDDHVHAIVQPAAVHRLEEIVRSWKSYSAHQLQRAEGRIGALWQNEYFDRIVRNYAELHEKMAYILNNPRKRWPGEESYPWVWAIGVS